MSKRREGDDNWYSLDFDRRRELMGGHGKLGRKFSGRVIQLITGATGLSDWEWGVTLLSDDPKDIKDIVYEMRFDEVSARYGEFGPFTVGWSCRCGKRWRSPGRPWCRTVVHSPALAQVRAEAAHAGHPDRVGRSEKPNRSLGCHGRVTACTWPFLSLGARPTMARSAGTDWMSNASQETPAIESHYRHLGPALRGDQIETPMQVVPIQQLQRGSARPEFACDTCRHQGTIGGQRPLPMARGGLR